MKLQPLWSAPDLLLCDTDTQSSGGGGRVELRAGGGVRPRPPRPLHLPPPYQIIETLFFVHPWYLPLDPLERLSVIAGPLVLMCWG